LGERQTDSHTAIFGWLADHSQSRRGLLLVGHAFLACSTMLLHKAEMLWLLVLARILQGLSAAAVCSVGFAMLHDAFGNDGFGGALGWISAALDAGGFLGPGLSGILYEVSGENAVFFFAYAFITLDAAMGLAVIVDRGDAVMSKSLSKETREYVRLPVSLIEEGMPDSTSVADCPSAAGDSNASIIRLLCTPRLLVATSSWLVIGIIETAFDSVLPIFVQDTFHWPVIGAGLVFMAFYLPSIFLSPCCGYAIDRIRNSSRILGSGGFFLCGPSFILLGLVGRDSIEEQVLLCVLLTLIGVGTAFSGPPLLKEVGIVVEQAQKGYSGSFGPKGAVARAYGIHNSAFAIGNLLGPILAGLLNSAFGWAIMGWFFGVLSLITGVVVLLSLEGWIGEMAWSI
jgi:MFS family permease